jgi:hypothetical protein
MMNRRHPTETERQIVRILVTDIGAVELIRLIGQMIANDGVQVEIATAYRSALMKVARELDAELGLAEKIRLSNGPYAL